MRHALNSIAQTRKVKRDAIGVHHKCRTDGAVPQTGQVIAEQQTKDRCQRLVEHLQQQRLRGWNRSRPHPSFITHITEGHSEHHHPAPSAIWHLQSSSARHNPNTLHLAIDAHVVTQFVRSDTRFTHTIHCTAPPPLRAYCTRVLLF